MTNPMNTADVMVEAVDFFRIPKYNGIKLTPAVIKALSSSEGTVSSISFKSVDSPKRPNVGFKK